ncbi:MAG: HD domain-containing protein [Pseudomonadota bacterium]
MSPDDIKLYDLVQPADVTALTRELDCLLGEMAPGLDLGPLHQAVEDTVRLYRGQYPGYRAANTKYHDLEHALAATLAFLRLAHGAFCLGDGLPAATLHLAVTAALFHDAGLIQTLADTEGTGAKYTIGHELRSMAFVSYYLSQRGYRGEDIENCAHVIAATILGRSLKDIPFRDEAARRAGQMMGAADLLAQMADRMYLEKVLLLYQEFEEARLPGFSSELDLLRQTEGFYEFQAKKRLDGDLGGVQRFLRPHFKHRWGVERDLYQDSVERNLDYLRSILHECEASYREHLRRGGIVDNLANGV